MKSIRSYIGGLSAIQISAAFSVIVLLTVLITQTNGALRERDQLTSYVAAPEPAPQTTEEESIDAQLLRALSPDSTPTQLGSTILDNLVTQYISLQEQGLYTPEMGEKVAEQIAETLQAPVSYRIYTASDVTTVDNNSYEAMLAYRAELQKSLAPLLKNERPEYETYAYYVKTKDKKYLAELAEVAANYRAAVEASVRVAPPKEALVLHLGVLNAMSTFAATLDTLSAHADDPLASVAALRTYNQAEADVVGSFSALAKYYREKRS